MFALAECEQERLPRSRHRFGVAKLGVGQEPAQLFERGLPVGLGAAHKLSPSRGTATAGWSDPRPATRSPAACLVSPVWLEAALTVHRTTVSGCRGAGGKPWPKGPRSRRAERLDLRRSPHDATRRAEWLLLLLPHGPTSRRSTAAPAWPAQGLGPTPDAVRWSRVVRPVPGRSGVATKPAG